MNIIRIIDFLMTCCWMTTYTLVLIGSLKYKTPLISPITQAIIAPFELGVFLGFLFGFLISNYVFNYVLLAYLYWTAMEIAVIIVIAKQIKPSKPKLTSYILFMILLTIFVLIYVNIFDFGMLYGSYIHTIIGMVFWYIYILDPKYPMKPISLAVFIVKLVGDILGFIVYRNYDGILIFVIAITLPIIDLFFIITYFYRKKNEDKYINLYNTKILPLLKNKKLTLDGRN